MSYLVLARKWRPKNFGEMVGQEHVVQALTNALTTQQASGAIANLTGALDIYSRNLTGSGVLDVLLRVDLSGRAVGSGASAAAFTTAWSRVSIRYCRRKSTGSWLVAKANGGLRGTG